jgi:predicted RNA-binding protein YlqC (UPF0109 family)
MSDIVTECGLDGCTETVELSHRPVVLPNRAKCKRAEVEVGAFAGDRPRVVGRRGRSI